MTYRPTARQTRSSEHAAVGAVFSVDHAAARC
jgi:hypothetical protein